VADETRRQSQRLHAPAFADGREHGCVRALPCVAIAVAGAGGRDVGGLEEREHAPREAAGDSHRVGIRVVVIIVHIVVVRIDPRETSTKPVKINL
jgi:hypothetical protein